MKLSIVSTLYKSEAYIIEFYQRATSVAQKQVDNDYEIVFVNDGSPDKSLEIAVQLTKNDSHVVVIELSRNFGHHKAMMTGLEYSKGNKVFLLDSDLEEEPEWLLKFSEQMEQEKCDVVYGEQEKRKGVWFERWSGKLYYWALDLMLYIEHPKNITTARLMVRDYVDALLLHKEQEITISGLWVITGFVQQAHTVIKKSTSATTHNILYKLSHLVNAITSFSNKPLIIIFFTGMTIFICSLISALILVINRLFFSVPLDGWTSIVTSIWLLGGITISFIGIIGVYLSKVFTEVKRRPYVITRNIYRG